MEEKRKQYSQVILILLAIFLGGYGVHQFVVGNVKRGFLYLSAQIGAIVGVIIMYLGVVTMAINDNAGFGFIGVAIFGGLIAILSIILSLVVFVFIIIDVVKIAQGTFLTGDGYPAVEGH